jgi:parvulin-like peptidyl-prolyl isomerase
MKKMLFTLTAVGALAVPAGVALAQSDAAQPAAPVVTCADQVRDRDRDRTADQTQAADQVRQQLQLRLHDGTCDADCTGDQARQREQAQVQDGVATTTQQRNTAGQTGRGNR